MKITTATLITMLALGSSAFAQDSIANTTTVAAPAAIQSSAKTQEFQVNRMAAIHASSTIVTVMGPRALESAPLQNRSILNAISIR